MLSKLNNKPYTLHTTLEPNQIYSCFGIKIKVKEQVDTFSNKGNFSIHINNINLKALKSQSHNTITKDTPLFCYVQESNQTHIVKLQDSTTSINIQLNNKLQKDLKGNLIPIIPKLIFLSFIPFKDSKEANNSPSQKIALTADDIDKNYINVDFKIPLKYLGEWQNIKTHKLQQAQSNKSKEIISIRFNGKTLQILEKGKTTQEFTFKAQSGDNGNKETMIEEGNYYIKANEVIEANIINNVNIDINQFNLGNKYIKLHKNTSDKNIADKNTSNNNTANKNTSNNKTSNKETNNKTIKDNSLLTKALNLVKIQSTAYTIHGGKSYGDNKGIDLATQDLAFFKALQKLTNKYKIELESINNEIGVEVGYGKSEIDLRGQTTPNGGKVEWISQFDTRKEGMGTNAGGEACAKTCVKILKNAGISSVENPNNNKVTYQVAIEKDMGYNTKSKTYQRDKNMNLTDTNKQNQDEYMQVDTQAFQNGLAYLDSELEAGYPVMIGVDHHYSHGKNKKGYNNDFTTDHFVVIVGRKYDDKGELCYLFYDVGTGKNAFFIKDKDNKWSPRLKPDENLLNKEYKPNGTSDYNRLYIKNNMLKGQTQISSKNNYVVTQIRLNIAKE